MESDSDRRIVDAVLAGDRDAYRILVERESEAVLAVCLRILRDPDEAQDAAQEAFVQAYRSLAGFRAEGSFGAWIGRIAARSAVNRAVRLRRRGWQPEEMALELADEGADPERQAMLNAHADSVREALRHLPSDQRTVLTLRYFGDLQIDEISEATGVPIGTVKSRLHRGLGRLRRRDDLRPAQ